MKLTEHCHHLLKGRITENQTIIDATVGNGKDTIFLADCLNNTGKLIGFDIQETAINSTSKILFEKGYDNFSLFCRSHAQLKETLQQLDIQSADVIVFNLGYLPGGDPEITTTADETIGALSQSLEILSPRGVLSIMVYPGHPAGNLESLAIQEWIKTVPANYQLTRTEVLNTQEIAPYLLYFTM